MRPSARSKIAAAATALAVAATVAAAPTPSAADGDGLAEFRNNVAISYGPGTGSDFDGAGFAYSQLFHTPDGSLVTPGQTFSVDGIDYTWPSAAAGEPDNIESDGQLIPIAASPGATKLGFLGMGHNGSGAAAILLNYSDGSQEKAFVQLADWWDALIFDIPGNVLVVQNPSFVISDYVHGVMALGVYAASVPVDASKTLVSVQLSKNAGQHYVDIQVDKPA